jgi:hypothetical protein
VGHGDVLRAVRKGGAGPATGAPQRASPGDRPGRGNVVRPARAKCSQALTVQGAGPADDPTTDSTRYQTDRRDPPAADSHGRRSGRKPGAPRAEALASVRVGWSTVVAARPRSDAMTRNIPPFRMFPSTAHPEASPSSETIAHSAGHPRAGSRSGTFPNACRSSIASGHRADPYFSTPTECLSPKRATGWSAAADSPRAALSEAHTASSWSGRSHRSALSMCIR